MWTNWVSPFLPSHSFSILRSLKYTVIPIAEQTDLTDRRTWCMSKAPQVHTNIVPIFHRQCNIIVERDLIWKLGRRESAWKMSSGLCWPEHYTVHILCFKHGWAIGPKRYFWIIPSALYWNTMSRFSCHTPCTCFIPFLIFCSNSVLIISLGVLPSIFS